MSNTVELNIRVSPKPVNWCESAGFEHAWRDGPQLTCNPPILTRECANCGKRQYLRPAEWCDAP